MRLIKSVGTPRLPATISPAALVLAGIIAAATHPWASQALCAQTDPYLFYSDSPDAMAQAKVICLRCLVRNECLTHAIKAREDFGVWGGLDRDERRQLLRRQSGHPHRKSTA